MPLKFGKIGAFIALLTIAAFVLWLLWTSFFAGEEVEDDAALHDATNHSFVIAGLDPAIHAIGFSTG